MRYFAKAKRQKKKENRQVYEPRGTNGRPFACRRARVGQFVVFIGNLKIYNNQRTVLQAGTSVDRRWETRGRRNGKKLAPWDLRILLLPKIEVTAADEP